jgi:hypothetical protein
MDVMLVILGALTSLLAGDVASSEAIQKLVRLMLGKKPPPKHTPIACQNSHQASRQHPYKWTPYFGNCLS